MTYNRNSDTIQGTKALYRISFLGVRAMIEYGYGDYNDYRIDGWVTLNGGHVFIDDKTGVATKGNPQAVEAFNKNKAFQEKQPKEFCDKLSEAKKTVNEDARWRVSDQTPEDIKEYHPNSSLIQTNGGSTIAIDKDSGDIYGVCKNRNDKMSGKELIAYAVEHGGTCLDSYEGNHGFYVKCGFEPVSWCKWDDRFAPQGWNAERDQREDIVFYKFVGVGKVKNIDLSEFKQNTAVSKDYDTAQGNRDKELKK